MQNTDNFDLKIYEGKDLFNPLVVENANVQAIDTQMKKNENHTVGDATELVSGTVHALTRLTPDTPMLRFTATSRFTAGDTFTVDGVQVSALTVSGEQLPDGAYVIGSEVLAYLKGTLLTFFTSQGTLATAQNALKLGGNTPDYYATAVAVQQAQNTATAAGNLANEVNSNLDKTNQSLKSIGFSRVATSSEKIVVSANTHKRTVISLADHTEEIAFCCVSKVSAYGGSDNFLTNCGIEVNSEYKYRANLDLTSNVSGTYLVQYILFIK